MKKIFVSIVAFCSSLALLAQVETATDVEKTFSPRNLMANRTEFELSSICNFYHIDIQNLTGNISSVEYTIGEKKFICSYNDNNQLATIKQDGEIVCKLLYNSKNKAEIIQFDKQIIAKTYDKKGRVVSEALLFPYQPTGTQQIVEQKAKTMMAGDYIYTDVWKKQMNDSTAKIYLYEVLENGSTQAWAIDRMFVYDYNRKGLITEKIETAQNPSRNAVYDFSYKKGLLQEQVKSYSNSNLVEGSTYFYENDLLTKVNKGYFKSTKGKNPPLISSETNVILYDAQGKISGYTSTDGYRSDSCTFQRDENQRIIKIQKKQENGEMLPLFQCEYNDKNYVTKRVRSHSAVIVSYEFDDKGNWTRQEMKKIGGDAIITTRSIQYK